MKQGKEWESIFTPVRRNYLLLLYPTSSSGLENLNFCLDFTLCPADSQHRTHRNEGKGTQKPAPRYGHTYCHLVG